jgi:decaprenyl-phosphate phosphoribosyltransferase
MGVFLDYLALLRPRYHLPFTAVVISAFVFGTPPPPAIALRLIALFVSFCLCLYGALYTINGIADRKIDAVHPRKKDRPIAAGRVSPRAAWIYAFVLLAAAFITAWLWFGIVVVALYVAFAAVNVTYSYALKRVPYLELAGNAATHPLRVLLGAAIAAGTISVPLFTAYFCLSIGFSTMRRVLEKKAGEKSGRPVLRFYTLHDLWLVNLGVSAALFGHLFFMWPQDDGWYVAFFVSHLVVAFAAPNSRLTRMLIR